MGLLFKDDNHGAILTIDIYHIAFDIFSYDGDEQYTLCPWHTHHIRRNSFPKKSQIGKTRGTYFSQITKSANSNTDINVSDVKQILYKIVS